MAEGEWIALLNSDAFPDPDWLAQLVHAASEYPGAFFASRQIQANHPQLLDGDGDIYFTSGLAQRRNFNVPHYSPGPPREVFSACAAAAFYRRQDFLDAGGFDEDYFAYMEDVDLGFRLRLRGLRCYLVPTAVVHHVGAGATGDRSDFSTYYGHRNLVWTYFKDMPNPWLWLYMPLHLAWGVISVLYFIARGHGLVILRAKWDALRGLPPVLGKRKCRAGRPPGCGLGRPAGDEPRIRSGRWKASSTELGPPSAEWSFPTLQDAWPTSSSQSCSSGADRDSEGRDEL